MGRIESTVSILLGFALIGGVFAMIEYLLYQKEIIVNAYIGGEVTLYALMFITVFFWELMGVVIAATQR